MSEGKFVSINEDDIDNDLISYNTDNIKNRHNDNDLINENNRSDNVYNYLSNVQHISYKVLTNYIKDFEKTKSDILYQKPNICDVYLKKAYNIPEGKIEYFMKLLNNCQKDKMLKLNFTELQLSDKQNKIGSGLMYDFDILQNEKYSKLRDFGFTTLISEILDIINNILDFTKYGKNSKMCHYACIIQKKEVEYKENEGKYKDGFHILIPSIQTTKEVKKYIFHQILKSKNIKSLFETYNIKDELENIMDKGSYSVPVHFLYNCKVNKEPYIISKIFKISYINNKFSIPESFNFTSRKQVNRDDDDDDNEYSSEKSGEDTINLIYEFSLNYTYPKGIVKKYYYEIKESLTDDIEYYDEKNNNIDEFLDKNVNDISILTLHNPNTKFIRELLYLLSDERCKDRNMWRDVIYVLVNESPTLKPLAIEFSKKNSKKWDPVGFEKLWNEAISKDTDSKLTLRSLIYWAKMDNLNEYEKIINKDIKQIIKKDICSSILHGNLFHYQFANYLKHMFNEKFVTDEICGKTVWYEFVISSDRYVKGQVYKWREESKPINLYIYISAVLPKILQEIIQETDNYIKTIEDNDSLVEYFVKLKNNIINSTKKLYDTGFKTKLIKESEVLFRKRGFVDSLNKDAEIMGVGNGILVLSKNPYLITSYHNYPITRFSPINYVEYDENNPNIQLLEKTMSELFPKHELDALEFMLYYFATCLDGIPKDSMIFIITGVGSNGKSFLLNLVKEVLGNEYCRRLPLAFLTDKRTKSSGADPSLMDLESARLAHYSESEKNEELNTSKMKEITGQESLSGRNLYEKQKNFRPTCHHIITTNHDFDVKTTDNGTWRRIKKYVFKMKFCASPDPNNPYEKKENTELAKEFSYNIRIKEAFLSILVKYYKQLHTFHKGSLANVPKPTIDRETEEYRNSQDIYNRFINDLVIISPDSEISVLDLVSTYKQWYVNNIDNSEIKIPNVELGKQLINSKICKYIKRNLDGIKLNGLRTVESGLPDLEKNERFICNNKQEELIKSLK